MLKEREDQLGMKHQEEKEMKNEIKVLIIILIIAAISGCVIKPREETTTVEVSTTIEEIAIQLGELNTSEIEDISEIDIPDLNTTEDEFEPPIELYWLIYY